MCHFYNKIRKNLLIICPILNLQGCNLFIVRTFYNLYYIFYNIFYNII
jgi:hypothetical protein